MVASLSRTLHHVCSATNPRDVSIWPGKCQSMETTAAGLKRLPPSTSQQPRYLLTLTQKLNYTSLITIVEECLVCVCFVFLLVQQERAIVSPVRRRDCSTPWLPRLMLKMLQSFVVVGMRTASKVVVWYRLQNRKFFLPQIRQFISYRFACAGDCN